MRRLVISRRGLRTQRQFLDHVDRVLVRDAAFLMAFGALYKSISLRILLDLLDRPGHAGLYSAILARYVAAESFENRLTVMQENGFAVPTPAGYALTDKGRRLAGLVGVLHRLFAIERSG